MELNGKQGFVPASYVRKIETPPTMTTPTSSLTMSGAGELAENVRTRQTAINSKSVGYAYSDVINSVVMVM